MRRIAAAASRIDTTAIGIAGLLNREVPALFTKAIPITSRIKIRPIPGQPPAKVEYKRRNGRTSRIRIHLRIFAKRIEPQEWAGSSLF
jgi:hypothetical protein